MSNNPLNDSFNMNPENLEEEEAKVFDEITEEMKSLDHIIEEALKTYNSIMDDIEHIEPKNRARHFDIAERFLNQSKDSIYKKEQLEIKQEELKLKKNKGSGKANDKNPSNKEQDGSGGKTREELMKAVARG